MILLFLRFVFGFDLYFRPDNNVHLMVDYVKAVVVGVGRGGETECSAGAQKDANGRPTE